jgi:hypothetical protein
MNINDEIAEWIVSVMAELGDPEKIRESAQPLTDHANEIRLVHAELMAAANSISWSGAAADAHAEQLRQQLRLAEEAAANLESSQNVVAEHTDKAAYIAKQIIGIILEILEVLIAGLILTSILSYLADLIWLRLAPLFQRVLDLLMRFRTALSDFTTSMSKLNVVAGRVAKEIETLMVTYLPAYSRSIPGFYFASGMPQLMSGRPVNWQDNAWQVALFSAFDLGLTMVGGVFAGLKLGGQLRELIVRGGDRMSQKLTFSRIRPDPVPPRPDIPKPLPPDGGSGISTTGRSRWDSLVDEVMAPLPKSAHGDVPSIPSTTGRSRWDSLVDEVMASVPKSAHGDVPSVPSTMGQPSSVLDEVASPAPIKAFDTPNSLTEKPVAWDQFTPKSPGEALHMGLNQAFNTGLGNTMLAAAVADIKNQAMTPEDFALSFALGFTLAGARDGLLHHLPVGNNWAYRQQPEWAPAVQRWVASIPTEYSFYAMYFIAKDAIQNAISGNLINTELNPFQSSP